jgi:phosphate starvation-inducible protein PhoH and related proteins
MRKTIEPTTRKTRTNTFIEKEVNNKKIVEELCGSIKIKCKNEKQKQFLQTIKDNQITICIGPAGVGKSYLSIIQALKLLIEPDNNYQNIYIITPAVESEEKLGYLPGNLDEKLEPYLYSTYKLIDKIIGIENRKKLVAAEIIKPLALAYLRGWNIDNSILIFEESQNCTPRQMKTLLTRIGFDSKFIISGDLEQTDRYTDKNNSGLFESFNLMKNLNDVGIYQFIIESNDEIVRNPLIGDILKRYDLK